jgi:hypothetical protein
MRFFNIHKTTGGTITFYVEISDPIKNENAKSKIRSVSQLANKD